MGEGIRRRGEGGGEEGMNGVSKKILYIRGMGERIRRRVGGGGEERMKGVSKKILEEVGKDGKPNL